MVITWVAGLIFGHISARVRVCGIAHADGGTRATPCVCLALSVVACVCVSVQCASQMVGPRDVIKARVRQEAEGNVS